MGILYIVRGLPGSGKSKGAKEWVANDPTNRARVNRDDLRAMMHQGYFGEYTEEQVTEVQYAMIDTLLDMGKLVICDDTNLKDRTVQDLIGIAMDHEAKWEIVDKTNVPLDLCLIANNSQHRIDTNAVVPDEVIVDMHERYIKDKGYPLPVPEVKR